MFIILYFIVFIGGFFASANITLLGINFSFLQGTSLLGYCVFPLIISALIVRLIGGIKILNFLIVSGSAVWAILSSLGFIISLVEPKRKFLCLYPIILYYSVLSMLVLTI